MFHGIERVVYAMASLRFISGILEVLGGLTMLYFGTASKALQVNGLLALVGPFVLIAVTVFGVVGIADGVSVRRILLLIIGVACILFATRT
ncbi:DUF2619 domain-containing protein [Alicyclobacillus ferrooxydans]|uniref:DUF2619 domain-containing protein n=1 Tax=Alicyclobacillus ferrooxydans TaxID=471514 RepID=A0A0P9GP13_9BACL|nr:DUF2619 domain-containing protein [Alicyclobacillus ferrooxydans]KPV42316.1 hypothetical protein AN477_18640 [Alicyclobacillus ferrooxydans]